MKTENTSGYLLEGEPRVHFDEMDYMEDETFEYDGKYHLKKQLFTGIAYAESKGVVTEQSIVKGLREGKTLKRYSNGVFAKEAIYKDDEPIGEVVERYENGTVSSLRVFDETSEKLTEQEYGENGVLIKEILWSPEWRLRIWTNNGHLIYESTREANRIYSGKGTCVIEEKRQNDLGGEDSPNYNDNELKEHISELLISRCNMVEMAVFRWLNSKKKDYAKDILIDLLRHPDTRIVEDVLANIESRQISEALPDVKKLCFSRRKKPRHLGGYIGTTSQLAERVYQKLKPKTFFPFNKGNDKFLASVYEHRSRVNLIRRQRSRQIEKIKENWPQTEAQLVETIAGSASLKSGSQLFSESVNESLVCFYVYKYSVNGCTYKATKSGNNSNASNSISLRFRPKKPDEYILTD
jgi:antitoxin component YwqK of YwqJK toxin-antitoxin module